jgi:transcriptional coactivator HFI1/ADA1
VGVDDPEFDTDDTFIEPKARVHQWVVGMSSRERARVRRAVMGRANEMEVEGDEEELGSWGDGRKRRWSSFQPSESLSPPMEGLALITSDTAMPPLALSSRLLPSSHQLSHRLAQMAKAYDLTLAHDAFADIGDFMAVGMDAHLGDILHGIVHLTGRERPGEDTIRVPKGVKLEPEDHMEVDGGPSIKQEPNGDMPKPDLETFQSLFIMAPNLHPQASPAVYKLQTSQTLSEVEYKRPVKFERKSSPPPSPRIGDITVSGSPKNSAVNAGNKVEMVTKNLLETGLLKLDKAGRHSEAGEPEGKKERKHNLHWKYEDPALILKDLLG